MIDRRAANRSYREGGWRRHLSASLLAGAVAVAINVVIYLLMVSLEGPPLAWLILVSIVVASLLPNLLAGLAFFGLSRIAPQPRLLLTVGVALFVLISILPHLGVGPAPSPALAALPEGFDLLTVPLHLVFGLTAILLIPRFVRRPPLGAGPA